LAPLTDVPAGTPMTSDLQAGRRDRVDGLLPAVYEELRSIARRQLSNQESEGTFLARMPLRRALAR
jgi:hypothetical protein